MKNIILIITICIVISACKTQTASETVVYNNDIENNNLTGITNGVTGVFNGSTVLGQYNNGGFTLKVDNLPKHALLTITFDLYIHDNWRGQLPPDGADTWQMLVSNALYINTTFSNLRCDTGNICPPQAYPADYPNNYNNPRTGAFRVDLPGMCNQAGIAGGTTQYKIRKNIKHSDKVLLLQCLDKLNQSNHADPKCDKSWSVDNIVVKAITL